jgi:hypothetical protein
MAIRRERRGPFRVADERGESLPCPRCRLCQGGIEKLLHLRPGLCCRLLVPAGDGPHADSEVSGERIITQSQRGLQHAR